MHLIPYMIVSNRRLLKANHTAVTASPLYETSVCGVRDIDLGIEVPNTGQQEDLKSEQSQQGSIPT
jgi:hypothetical protein